VQIVVIVYSVYSTPILSDCTEVSHSSIAQHITKSHAV